MTEETTWRLQTFSTAFACMGHTQVHVVQCDVTVVIVVVVVVCVVETWRLGPLEKGFPSKR